MEGPHRALEACVCTCATNKMSQSVTDDGALGANHTGGGTSWGGRHADDWQQQHQQTACILKAVKHLKPATPMLRISLQCHPSRCHLNLGLWPCTVCGTHQSCCVTQKVTWWWVCIPSKPVTSDSDASPEDVSSLFLPVQMKLMIWTSIIWKTYWVHPNIVCGSAHEWMQNTSTTSTWFWSQPLTAGIGENVIIQNTFFTHILVFFQHMRCILKIRSSSSLHGALYCSLMNHRRAELFLSELLSKLNTERCVG